MPDVNSFRYMRFAKSEIPAFFQEYDKEDRYQQLSMTEALRQLLNAYLWEEKLRSMDIYESMDHDMQRLWISCVMHMGSNSLQVLMPQGPERLRGDLEQIAQGVRTLSSQGQESADEQLVKFVGDRWLPSAFVDFENDLEFALWSDWEGEGDKAELMKAIRSAPAAVET
ncbi:hypothetical protein FB45DRAFT_897505 [Roridomyces roridus]|uniref:Uncharacterized protein n=1 Tax=Roridomyces roridus TaxID=1738132 RepID=A0AAD7FUR1_9AGAR|nr:hypothetical protein FB45DRAFT_897505 [Roridomyces roridus]